jgi:multidrug efflux pump subunit AcrB
MRIQVDPAKLVAKGLSLEDVRDQISQTTVNSRKGNRRQNDSFTIYANDQLTAAQAGTTSSSPIATARRCASATSARP